MRLKNGTFVTIVSSSLALRDCSSKLKPWKSLSAESRQFKLCGGYRRTIQEEELARLEKRAAEQCDHIEAKSLEVAREVFAGCAGDYYVGGPYEGPYYGDFGPYCSGYGASVRRRFGDRRISLPKPFLGAPFLWTKLWRSKCCRCPRIRRISWRWDSPATGTNREFLMIATGGGSDLVQLSPRQAQRLFKLTWVSGFTIIGTPKRVIGRLSYLACLLQNHFVRIFVFPDSEKDWLTETIIPGSTP
jgi:hypothetical protein